LAVLVSVGKTRRCSIFVAFPGVVDRSARFTRAWLPSPGAFASRLSLRERIEVRAAGAKRTRNFRIAVAPMLRLNTSGKQTMRSTIPAIGHCVPQRSDL
jgi:hypothetical protein